MSTLGDPGLRARATRGAFSSVTARLSQAMVQLALNVALARILTPDEYGVVAMAVAISGLAIVLQDFGLSSAALQAAELRDEDSSTLFYMSSCVGGLLALLMVAGAHALAGFYHEPRVAAVATVLAVSLLITGISTQFTAQHLRAMRFTIVALSDVATTCVTAAVSIGLALAGAGYWSMVFGMVAGSATRLIVLLSRTKWLPGRAAPFKRVAPLIKVGASVAATQVMNYSSQTVDTLLIGRYRGARDVAYYSRGYFLVLYPMQQLTGPLYNVAVPTLSRFREDGDGLNRALRRLVSGMAYMVLPAYAVLVSSASDVVELIFGRAWFPAAVLVQILAIAGAARLFANVLGWLALVTQRTGRQLGFTVASVVVTLCSLTFGIQFGTSGVAWAYSTSAAILVPIGFVWVLRGSIVSPITIARAALAPFLLSLAILVAGLGVQAALSDQAALLRLSATVACWPACLALAALWSPIRKDVRGLISILRSGLMRN